VTRGALIRTLLVEACPTKRAALAETLARCGCDVTAAAGDDEAYASHVADEYPLAVVGVDHMPDQGFWFCRRLRSSSQRTDPIILALSGRWDAGRLAWLIEAGVDDCLIAPPDEAWLATRVDLVRQRAGFRRLEQEDVDEHLAGRRLARQALRESERMLRGLVENLPDTVVVAGADWTIQFINRTPPGMMPKEIIGRSALQFMLPEHRQRLVDARQRLLEGHGVQTVEIVDNAGLSWAMRIVPFAENEADSGMLLICTDVTDRKGAAEAVWREQASLRRMLDLFERDRELIAFEIHDGLSQQLTGALLNFESARQAQPRSDEGVDGSFGRGLGLLRESIAEARRLIRGLRPPVLDAFGIVPAVEHLIEDHQTAGGGRVEFAASGLTGRLAQPLESALFRTVQETLNNARRHSNSDRIQIDLSQDSRHVRVEIRDWGVGFDPESVGEDHFGLQGIRQRARLLGGTAEIASKPGDGTRICVELPLVERLATGEESSAEA